MGALWVLAQMRLVPFPRERERVGGGSTLGTGPNEIGAFSQGEGEGGRWGHFGYWPI